MPNPFWNHTIFSAAFLRRKMKHNSKPGSLYSQNVLSPDKFSKRVSRNTMDSPTTRPVNSDPFTTPTIGRTYFGSPPRAPRLVRRDAAGPAGVRAVTPVRRIFDPVHEHTDRPLDYQPRKRRAVAPSVCEERVLNSTGEVHVRHVTPIRTTAVQVPNAPRFVRRVRNLEDVVNTPPRHATPIRTVEQQVPNAPRLVRRRLGAA